MKSKEEFLKYLEKTYSVYAFPWGEALYDAGFDPAYLLSLGIWATSDNDILSSLLGD